MTMLLKAAEKEAWSPVGTRWDKHEARNIDLVSHPSPPPFLEQIKKTEYFFYYFFFFFIILHRLTSIRSLRGNYIRRKSI